MPKPKRKCSFNDDWMRDDRFKQWLQKDRTYIQLSVHYATPHLT